LEETAERPTFVQYTFFKADPAWRRRPAAEREAGRAEFARAVQAACPSVNTYAYSTLGLKAGVDLMLWRYSESLEDLQEMTAALLETGLGRYLEIAHSLFGMTRPSVYVRRREAQDQSLFSPERSKYLVIYPFTKTIPWYLLGKPIRQGMMNDHIRVGHDYRSIRQVLVYSFGLDDQEFIVSYETDRLDDFQSLVMALRETEARRYTLIDTPIYTCIHRPVEEALGLLG
jgi:chlorite dismutase